MVEQIATCSLWKAPHARAGGYLKEAVTLWGACAGAGSCQDLWTCGERSPCWKRCAGRVCDLMTDPRWSSLFLKDCTPWKDPHWGNLCRAAARGKDSHWRSSWRKVCHERDTALEPGKSVRSRPPEEEGAAETMCDELTVTPIPCPPVLLGGGRR